MMPKPDLVPLTGGYRRIPVLQIGADVVLRLAADRARARTPASAADDVPGRAAKARATPGTSGPIASSSCRVVAVVFADIGHMVPAAFMEDRAKMMPRPRLRRDPAPGARRPRAAPRARRDARSAARRRPAVPARRRLQPGRRRRLPPRSGSCASRRAPARCSSRSRASARGCERVDAIGNGDAPSARTGRRASPSRRAATPLPGTVAPGEPNALTAGPGGDGHARRLRLRSGRRARSSRRRSTRSRDPPHCTRPRRPRRPLPARRLPRHARLRSKPEGDGRPRLAAARGSRETATTTRSANAGLGLPGTVVVVDVDGDCRSSVTVVVGASSRRRRIGVTSPIVDGTQNSMRRMIFTRVLEELVRNERLAVAGSAPQVLGLVAEEALRVALRARVLVVLVGRRAEVARAEEIQAVRPELIHRRRRHGCGLKRELAGRTADQVALEVVRDRVRERRRRDRQVSSRPAPTGTNAG